MNQSSIPSLNPVSYNNQKVDHALDVLVESAYCTDLAQRSDREELEKTSQLMLFFSLILGDTDSTIDLDSE